MSPLRHSLRSPGVSGDIQTLLREQGAPERDRSVRPRRSSVLDLSLRAGVTAVPLRPASPDLADQDASYPTDQRPLRLRRAAAGAERGHLYRGHPPLPQPPQRHVYH